MNRAARRLLGAAAGVALDRALGEPPLSRTHPVALFGTCMKRAERLLYHDNRAAGFAHAAIGVSAATAAGLVLRSTIATTYVATAGNALHGVARAGAIALRSGDVERTRSVLPAMVGRDPSQLDDIEMARALVESVAENTVDAIVAPALWAATFGAAGALAHRAADTLDSMVGYRDERYRRFGWAAARTDDVMAWVPARVTAALVALVRPRAAAAIWRAVRDDAPHHPSPNAGVAEAAFAAALGLQLGGTVNRYAIAGGGEIFDRRPTLGTGRAPVADDVDRAVRLSRDVTWTLIALLILTARGFARAKTPSMRAIARASLGLGGGGG